VAWHEHLVMRNREDGSYELRCGICRIAVVPDLPITIDDFLALIAKFSEKHQHDGEQ